MTDNHDAWGGSWGESWGESWYRLFDNAWPRQPVAGRKRARVEASGISRTPSDPVKLPAVAKPAAKPAVKPARPAAKKASPSAGYEDDPNPELTKQRRAAQAERSRAEAKEGEERRQRARAAAEDPKPKEESAPPRAEALLLAPTPSLPPQEGGELAEEEVAEVLALVMQQEQDIVLTALQALMESGELGEDFELPLAA